MSDRRVRKPLMLNIKTNLLYDAVGFPSLEIEIPIGQRFSINAEGAVAWNDPALAIDWRLPATDVILSEKDSRHPLLREATLLPPYQPGA